MNFWATAHKDRFIINVRCKGHWKLVNIVILICELFIVLYFYTAATQRFNCYELLWIIIIYKSIGSNIEKPVVYSLAQIHQHNNIIDYSIISICLAMMITSSDDAAAD